MTDSSIFISSCSKRQLALRRLARRVLWMQFLLIALIVLAAFAAYFAGRGVI